MLHLKHKWPDRASIGGLEDLSARRAWRSLTIVAQRARQTINAEVSSTGCSVRHGRAATELKPLRDIALATQDESLAARSLNAQSARSIGAGIRRVPLGTFRDRDLGIQRGLGYRP
jgi:hypothetical protein